MEANYGKEELERCPRPECGWEWIARVESPKQCPKCKQYLQTEKRRVKK